MNKAPIRNKLQTPLLYLEEAAQGAGSGTPVADALRDLRLALDLLEATSAPEVIHTIQGLEDTLRDALPQATGVIVTWRGDGKVHVDIRVPAASHQSTIVTVHHLLRNRVAASLHSEIRIQS